MTAGSEDYRERIYEKYASAFQDAKEGFDAIAGNDGVRHMTIIFVAGYLIQNTPLLSIWLVVGENSSIISGSGGIVKLLA